MKKICVMLAIALIVSGSVWGQEFDAVQTKSVEKQYSAGLFDSDVDNFIDPSFFDGQIGNFVFLGGFHNGYEGTAFNNYGPFGTYQDTDNDPDTPEVLVYDRSTLAKQRDTISVGYAKTLGTDKYLALYYGGSFVNGYGRKVTDPNPDDNIDVLDRTYADGVWRNKLAVLFGLNNMGFRFDLIMNNTDEHVETIDGKVSAQTIQDAPAVALSWGLNTGKLAPWVKLGFKFPDTVVTTNQNADGAVDKTMTRSTEAYFLFNAGAWLELDETSSVSADLMFGGELADSVKGDKDLIGTDPYTQGGRFDITLDVDYTKAVTFGDNTTVKLKPYLGVEFYSQSNDNSLADDKVPTDDEFSLWAGIDIGGEYRFDKIALYTGFGLRFFRWDHWGHSGGKTKNGDTNWEFRGIAWDPDAFGNTNGNLRFGLTFTPIEGLVFGAGFTFPIFNPVTMSTGNMSQYGAPTFWTGGVASITASYKFASKPKEPKAPKEDAE
jgi:hypothetical protein